MTLCPVTLRVKDVIDGKVVTIKATRPVADAVKEMVSNDVWSFGRNKEWLTRRYSDRT
jgi:predicted transcriptional regulator